MIVIWCMVPEIWSTTDRIFVNLDLFFSLFNQKIKIMKNEKNTQRYYYLTHVYQKWHSYDVWFLRYGAWQTKRFAILGHPLPFYLTINPENQNFKKMKKVLGDIIILHKCPKNHDHILSLKYSMWQM